MNIKSFAYRYKKVQFKKRYNLDDISKDNSSLFWGNDTLLVGLNINE